MALEVALVLVLGMGLAACGRAGRTAGAVRTAASRTTTDGRRRQPSARITGASWGDRGRLPEVAWAQLRNPILSEPDAGVKDQALVWAGGEWHMVFSYVTNDVTTKGAENWNIASATSPDLAHWSAAVALARPSRRGRCGLARHRPESVGNLRRHLRLESRRANGRPQSKLYYRTSSDLTTWSPPEPLAPGLHPAPGDRMIDAALAWTGHGLILGYKYGTATGSTTQHFEIAWSPSGSLRGPWTLVGRPDIVVDGDTVENLEFVAAAGRWHLVATSNTFDQPWIFTLSGDPTRPSSWLHWTRRQDARHPRTVLGHRARRLVRRVRARQLGLPLRRPHRPICAHRHRCRSQPTGPPATTTSPTPAAPSSPGSEVGVTPRSGSPAAPTSSTGRSPAEPPRSQPTRDQLRADSPTT